MQKGLAFQVKECKLGLAFRPGFLCFWLFLQPEMQKPFLLLVVVVGDGVGGSSQHDRFFLCRYAALPRFALCYNGGGAS